MNPIINEILETEKKAEVLFDEVEHRGLIFSGKTEHDLNEEIFELASELFGISNQWHKRVVRAGKNTLDPYSDNLQNLYIEANDVLTINLCPVFEGWEADCARTYILGADPYKQKLKQEIEAAWQETKAFFNHHTSITGSELYRYTIYLARKYGWEFGGHIAGHVTGYFPHWYLEKDSPENYIHPDNHTDMLLPDINGHKRDWVLEIHFIDKRKQIGGFVKQLLTTEEY